LGNKGNSMHDMQSVQTRINTACFASLLIWRVGT
jgi:hypothetical protein